MQEHYSSIASDEQRDAIAKVIYLCDRTPSQGTLPTSKSDPSPPSGEVGGEAANPGGEDLRQVAANERKDR